MVVVVCWELCGVAGSAAVVCFVVSTTCRPLRPARSTNASLARRAKKNQTLGTQTSITTTKATELAY